MNADMEDITAIKMLTAKIELDPLHARAKLALLEMEFVTVEVIFLKSSPIYKL